MSTIVWPPTLPSPAITGYSIQPGDAMLRTNMESGPARQRRRYEQVPTLISVNWTMDQNEFSIFQSWYIDQAEEGAAWFKVTLATGVGMVEHDARFREQFEAQLVNYGLWSVSSTLEVREQPQMEASLAEFLYTESLKGLQNAGYGLHALVHEFFPALFQ